MKCFCIEFDKFVGCQFLFLFDLKILYTGGMTEEKKILRRKALAKWLKESILRLGPTFIKVGQQFSTRVDILPQEYVDQLSELQVELEFWVELIRFFPCVVLMLYFLFLSTFLFMVFIISFGV